MIHLPRPHEKIFCVILQRDLHYKAPFTIIFKHFSFYINSQIIQHQINMTDLIKRPHTAIFIGQKGCGKTRPVLELITISILTTLLSSVRHSKKMIPIIPKCGSKTMIMFGLKILKTRSTNRLKSCQNCSDSEKYY